MSKYKSRLLAELKTAQEEARDKLAVALDDSKTARQRLAAFSKAGAISDESNAQKALAIIDDDDAHAGLRAAALEKIASYYGHDEQFLQKLTRIATRNGAPGELRMAALSSLRSNSFSSATLLSQRPAYIAALRALVDDEDDDIRETAIENLALNQDEYVQRRLIEGLENPKSKLTKPELAVKYLSYDLHADHFPILRKLAVKAPNKKTRMEALRNLAADADSADILKSVFADKSEDAELRHLCGVGLQRLDPVNFEKASNKILRARAEHQELKAAILNTKMHQPGADMNKLAADIKKLGNKAKGTAEKSRVEKLSSFAAFRKSG
ncbi:MAG: hypothetical protein AAF441_17595 [Pseudomonadota bacterium]